jgi:two-component system, LuxR family, response regulator FixJ
MSINQPDTLVYLVDDEFAVRDSLTLLIESTGQAVRSFESAQGFLNNYDLEKPGCLILDVRMPAMSGLELQGELLSREIYIPVIFISGHAGIPDSAKAFRAGAVDFLEKPFNNEILLERIEEAINKDIARREQLIENRKILNRIHHLTVREHEVLSLIASGHSNKETARILDISNRTVEAHRASIMEKMHANSLAELMVMVAHSETSTDKTYRR